MKKKRGMSLEEKRQMMMNIFKNNLSFFHYKEIEKFSIKNKISFMIVKELLQGLVADNLVETEKIGSSSYYWSLPSRISQVKFNSIEGNKALITQLKESIAATDDKIEENKGLRQETKERLAMIEKDEELGKQLAEVQKIVKDFEKNDPNKFKMIQDDSKHLVELNDNWADNLYCIEQWLKTKSPDIKLVDMFPQLIDFHIFD